MKKGKQSVIFQKDIFINDAASYVGKRESEGNLRDYFQNVLKDDLMKEKSYELAETKMQKMTVEKLLEVSGKTANDFDCIMGGDLQNQIFATSFCAREFDIPFFGLYGACSTFGEGLCAGGLFIESGNFKKNNRRYKQSFFVGGAELSFSAGTRQPANAFVAVDGNGVGRGDAFRRKVQGFRAENHCNYRRQSS